MDLVSCKAPPPAHRLSRLVYCDILESHRGGGGGKGGIVHG